MGLAREPAEEPPAPPEDVRVNEYRAQTQRLLVPMGNRKRVHTNTNALRAGRDGRVPWAAEGVPGGAAPDRPLRGDLLLVAAELLLEQFHLVLQAEL